MTRAVTIEACGTRPFGCMVGVTGGTLGPSTHILSSYKVCGSSKSISSPSPLIIIPTILILARLLHISSLVNCCGCREQRGTVQNKVDKETHFYNEFDQFVVEPGEALVSIYNCFAQLMNDLERNGITFPLVTVNTKFLNCLQPEWLKCVTQVRLAKKLTEDTFDDFFDYLQQFESLVNASRAKKLEKSHDPLVLVVHMSSSSRTPSPYYVTHPSSVVDYDDYYQGDAFQNNSEDPLISAMMLLARAITQHFSNPTNIRLRTSSNTKNQAIMQGDKVNIQRQNYGNDGRNTRHSYVQEEISEGNNVQNDAGNTQRTLRTTSSVSAANVQCYNCIEKVTLTDEQNDFLVADATRMKEIKELSANICLMAKIQSANIDSDAGPSYDSAFLSEVQKSSTSYVNPLFAKDNQEQKYPKQPKIINDTIGDDQIDSNIIINEPNVDVNSGRVEYDNNVQASYKLGQLARNAYKEAEEKQQIHVNNVKQQNKVLTQQLELYTEKVRVFEMTKGDNATFLNEFIEADSKARHLERDLQTQFIRDRDIIRDLKQK
ncbi:hypothetical protein Tco_0592513 [Tanacetum coccineum]